MVAGPVFATTIAEMDVTVPTGSFHRRVHRPRVAARLARWALLMAVLAGLAGMHVFGPWPAAAADAPAVSPLTGSLRVESAAAPRPGESAVPSHQDGHPACAGHRDHGGAAPCGGHEGHSGPVCEAGALASAGQLGAPTSVLAAVAGRVGGSSRVPPTVASGAAGGSGCGPPSLHALCISRT